jgi:hypothetical protein
VADAHHEGQEKDGLAEARQESDSLDQNEDEGNRSFKKQKMIIVLLHVLRDFTTLFNKVNISSIPVLIRIHSYFL